jgi:hypothetical protein
MTLEDEFAAILSSVMKIGEIGVERIEQGTDFPVEKYTKFSKDISKSIDALVNAIRSTGKQ